MPVPVRLLIGLLKGLILGALVGYGIAALGFGVPGAVIAYLGASVVGMLVALVAGKPIWASDARVEVGMKALAGAVLAPGLMWLSRRFLTMDLPLDPALIPGIVVEGSAAIGTFAITSLAMVAGVLAGFFDADNQPGKADDKAAAGAASKQRIDAPAAAANKDASEDLEEDEADAAQHTRKS